MKDYSRRPRLETWAEMSLRTGTQSIRGPAPGVEIPLGDCCLQAGFWQIGFAVPRQGAKPPGR